MASDLVERARAAVMDLSTDPNPITLTVLNTETGERWPVLHLEGPRQYGQYVVHIRSGVLWFCKDGRHYSKGRPFRIVPATKEERNERRAKLLADLGALRDGTPFLALCPESQRHD